MSKSSRCRTVAAGAVAVVAAALATTTIAQVLPHRMTRFCGWVRCGTFLFWLALAAPLAAQFNGVQVNVDAFGNDILGDAANEPSIAVDPNDPNRIAIGWRQFDTIASNFRQAGVAYSTDGGLTWSASVLDPGTLRGDPVLDFDADGNFYYSSLTFDDETYIYSVDMFTSTDGGATWSSPVPAFGGDKQWVAIDRTAGIGRGNIYQHWDVSWWPEVPDTSFTRSVDGAASFENPLAGPTSYMKWGTLNVGPDGTLYLAGATLFGRGHLFSKSTNAQDPTQTPSFTPSQPVSLGGTAAAGGVNPAGLLGQVAIASDHSQSSTHGNVYMLSSVNPTGADPLDVLFIRSTDQGDTWSDSIRVNNDPLDTNAYQWFGTMSVAPNGRIDAIWNDTRNDPTQSTSQLYYAYSFDAGETWLGNTPLSDPFDHSLGYPPQNSKLGDYYDMISDDTGVYLAYAATFHGGQDVYFLRIDAETMPDGGFVPEPASLGLLAAVIMVVSLWHGRMRERGARLLVNRSAVLRAATGIVAVAAVLAQTPRTQAQFLPKFFRDTFEDANIQDDTPVSWEGFHGEDLDASTGDLVLTSIDSFLGGAVVNGHMYGDVSVRTQLRVLEEPFIDAGVFARMGIFGEAYFAGISSSDWPLAPSSLVLSGGFFNSRGNYYCEILQQAPITLDPTQTDVMLQFDVIGDFLTLTAWADGTPKQSISYQDDRLPWGSIGLEYDDGINEFFFLEEATSATFRFFEAVPVPGADFDSDGDVDGDDFLAWQTGFGTLAGAHKTDGDYDSDGDVDGDDFLGWQAEFGSGSGSASAAVPEPASIMLLFMTLVSAMFVVRRH